MNSTWGAVAVALGCSIFQACAAQTVQPAGVTLHTLAEVEKKRADSAVERYWLTPADHVVAGDQLVYTVEIHNSRSQALDAVIVTNPIPERMGYIADSAAGPGCDIDFSVDGGHNFAKPDALRIALPAGQSRVATPLDYTHIRWKFKYALSGNATAYARFRAALK